MDYPSTSTSTALKSFYPRGRGEKPTVTVTFLSKGATYRIKKCFGTNKSELASQTSTGAWKVETTSASEVHSRICDLAEGDDSSKGLRQLLWLTQAEFRLPESRKFDTNIQSQLRSILGVLQTPLDDRFIERVKKRWNNWHSGQRKVGRTPQLKESCTLAVNCKRLSAAQEELTESDRKFNEVEALLRQSGDLESQRQDLQRQLEEQKGILSTRQQERECCQERIAAWKQANDYHARAATEQKEALNEQSQRCAAAQRLAGDEHALEPAQNRADFLAQDVKSTGDSLDRRRESLDTARDQRQDLQAQANRVAARQMSLTFAEQLESTKRDYDRAKTIAAEISEIEEYVADYPAPNDEALEALKANRRQATQLRAEQKAASISLCLSPEPNASTAELAIDGNPFRKLLPDASATQPVHRKAELIIPNWGRIEVRRGSGSSDLEQVEHQIQDCDAEFAKAVNAFGITASDPNAVDSLMQRAAENRQRLLEIATKKKELKRLAPQGLPQLQGKLLEFQTRLVDSASADSPGDEPLSMDRGELVKLAASLKDRLDTKDSEIATHGYQVKAIESKLEDLWKEETAAREELIIRKATVKNRREELQRMRSEEQISLRVAHAESALIAAAEQLRQAELTAEEKTIDDRLAMCRATVRALELQLRDTEEKFNRMKGRLEGSEGMHARRRSLAARVEELSRLRDRETLEKDAIDRLYELFEECRDKQLGMLMSPVQDRVLNWMRVLDIGDYNELRFSDAFLPEKLVRRDGTAEFTLDEESTGAQEQIGMLVRLALGSILTSTNEPTVAIFDDPLTHCDVGRVTKMRAILRRASAGDPNSSPPAGPLQIIVLTCHPEWFRDEHATVIDLQHMDVMQRLRV
jgi:DNA repair exonuclease SbcCD ATPase subunit